MKASITLSLLIWGLIFPDRYLVLCTIPVVDFFFFFLFCLLIFLDYENVKNTHFIDAEFLEIVPVGCCHSRYFSQ